MANSSEVREFLASRRARITPEQAGPSTYGAHRRVTGLRREEVALLAGVSVDEVASEPGLTLRVYTAEPDSATAEALGFLASWAAAERSATPS